MTEILLRAKNFELKLKVCALTVYKNLLERRNKKLKDELAKLMASRHGD